MTVPRDMPLNGIPGKREDVRALAAKVYERHGIALREDDPAFALVTLNQLMLQRLTGNLLRDVDQRMAARFAVFEQTMQRVEQRASKTLAQQVRESVAGLLEMLQGEIGRARGGILRMAEEVQSARQMVFRARWCAAAAVLALVMFGCGFWAGRL